MLAISPHVVTVLVLLSVGLMMWGGWKDLTEAKPSDTNVTQSVYPISKYHLWADGLWLLGLALLLQKHVVDPAKSL